MIILSVVCVMSFRGSNLDPSCSLGMYVALIPDSLKIIDQIADVCYFGPVFQLYHLLCYHWLCIRVARFISCCNFFIVSSICASAGLTSLRMQPKEKPTPGHEQKDWSRKKGRRQEKGGGLFDVMLVAVGLGLAVVLGFLNSLLFGNRFL